MALKADADAQLAMEAVRVLRDTLDARLEAARKELNDSLSASIMDLAGKQSGANAADILTRFAELRYTFGIAAETRIADIKTEAEKSFAAAGAKLREDIKADADKSCADAGAKVTASITAEQSARLTELERTCLSQIETTLAEFSKKTRRDMEKQTQAALDKTLEKQPGGAPSNALLDSFRGEYNVETLYKPGDTFGSRGGFYMVLKAVSGQPPTRELLKLGVYALLAAPGAPGQRGESGPAGPVGTTLPIGTILPDNPGTGWLPCDGTVYSQATYPTLFARIGHTPQFQWTKAAGFGTHIPQAIAYGGGVYVAVCADGAVFTSANLTSWTSRTSGTSNALAAVCYGNGLFVAVGNTDTVITSPDGITWTTRNAGASIGNFLQVVYQNSIFVGTTSTGYVAYSSNGTSWSSTQPSSLVTAGTIIFYTLGRWWIFNRAAGGASLGMVYSTNGTTWTYTAKFVTGNMTFSGVDSSYAYVFDTTNGDIYRSSDGATWAVSTAGAIAGLTSGQISTLVPSLRTGTISVILGGFPMYSLDAGVTWVAIMQRNQTDSGFYPVIPTNNAGGGTVNSLLGLGNKFTINFPTNTSFYSTYDGKSFYQSFTDSALLGMLFAVNGTQAHMANYANGYYFAFQASNYTSGALAFAAEPYDPTSNFQVPIIKNADGSYRYIRAA